MKQKTKLGFAFLAVATALGLASTAFAQEADTSGTAPSTSHSWGLLGSPYSGAAFTYDHVASSSPSEWRGFTVDLNQPLRTGLDFNLGYDWAQGTNYLLRLTQQNLNAGVTAYTALDWGKPFVQALAGWEWLRGNGPSTNSFAYTLGTGIELAATPALAVTPYVNFVRATGFNADEFDFGVKTTYRFSREWSATGGVQYAAVRHAPDDTGFSLGVNYHY